MNCKCTFSQRMTGDGCDICNPQMSAEVCAESLADAKSELSRLRELVEEMREALIGIGPFIAEDFPNGPDGESCAALKYRVAYQFMREAIAKSAPLETGKP